MLLANISMEKVEMYKSVEWKPVPGLADLYEVSNRGDVVRISTHGATPKRIRRPVNPHRKPNGYLAFDLQRDQTRDRQYAHRLVWRAFRGEIPRGIDVNHRNGVRDDNRLENLELVTRSENVIHGHRLMGRKGTKLTEQNVQEILILLADGIFSQQQIADHYGVSQASIGHISVGRNWKRIARST
jgi:hypothetical protein